jgi:intracellular septation protein
MRQGDTGRLRTAAAVEYPRRPRYMPGMPEQRSLNPGLKLALDFGPLVVFFAANARFGIFIATATLMVAMVPAVCVPYWVTRRVPVMPIVTAIAVLVFGTLTLVLQDELFIKLKPTIIYLLFGSILMGGLMFGKPLLGTLLDSVFHLTEEGWRRLTLRWALFFFALAALNEFVWRTQTTDFWVSFKVFGVLPLTVLFGALQYPLLTRYAAPEADKQEPSRPTETAEVN